MHPSLFNTCSPSVNDALKTKNRTARGYAIHAFSSQACLHARAVIQCPALDPLCLMMVISHTSNIGSMEIAQAGLSITHANKIRNDGGLNPMYARSSNKENGHHL